MKIYFTVNCDHSECDEVFNLSDQGVRRIPQQWRRAKALGWHAYRLPAGSHFAASKPGPDHYRLSLARWVAYCPQHVVK